MSALRLAVRQIRYENLAFWRNPPAAFFTIAFPLMFMAILNLAFGSQTIRLGAAEHDNAEEPHEERNRAHGLRRRL